MIERVVCIYPGRFQPFSKHHFGVYQMLCAKFGEDDVYIAPTLTTDNETNPLTPAEKIAFIKIYGIPADKIIPVRSPYKAQEIVGELNLFTTAVVFAYGEKDFGRIQFTKKDGTKSWFHPYAEKCTIPISDGGYAYSVPTITSASGIGNSTSLRDKMKSGMEYLDFCKMMAIRPNHDAWQIYTMLKNKLSPKSMTEIVDQTISKGRGKHLMHPWEDAELKYPNILELIKKSATGNLDYCIEKFDGQNFMVTYKNGQVFAARNKTEILNPLTLDQLRVKFEGRGNILSAFEWAMISMTSALKNANQQLLHLFFKDDYSFLNLEVIHPSTRNVVNYGPEPKLVLHSINNYNSSGDEVGRMVDINALVSHLNSVQGNIQGPRVIQLQFQPELYTEFKSALNQIWLQYNLKMNQSLGDLYVAIAPELNYATSIKQKEEILRTKVFPIIEKPFLILGAKILQKCSGYSRNGVEDILTKVKSTITNTSNPDFNKIQRQIRRLPTEFEKYVLSIEGVVFEYNGSLYKWTGVFGPINQILGFERYKR